MAKLNFDVPDASGGPTVTFGLDLDNADPTALADQLGLDDKTGAKLAAAVKGLAPDAQAQARLNKLVAAAVVAGTRALASGVSPASLLVGLV